jgi:NADPH:quinone reductase-like Zn-dependent oxidoreductase
MKAVRLFESPTGPRLTETEADPPTPGAGELLIRVHAAGVIPTELQWFPTSHERTGQKRTRAIPGHEFSGVAVQSGQEVFGMNDWFSDGATAEYCLAPASSVAPKPRSLSHAEAATVPISALTAWQGLFDRASLQQGEHVLVHGGAGAVGTFVVQLARLHVARVTGNRFRTRLTISQEPGRRDCRRLPIDPL